VVEAELESKKKICRGEFEKKKGKHREKKLEWRGLKSFLNKEHDYKKMLH